MDTHGSFRRSNLMLLAAAGYLVIAAGCGGDKGTGGDGVKSTHFLEGIWSVREEGASCEITSQLDPFWTYEREWVDTFYPGDLILDTAGFSGADLVLRTSISRVTFSRCIGTDTPDRVDMWCFGVCETVNCRGPIGVRFRGTPDSLTWMLQKNITITYGGARCGLADSVKICFRANTTYTRIGDLPASP